MPTHVSENLARLWKSASELNQLADEASEQIKSLSRFLDALNPSIEAVDATHFSVGREQSSTNRIVTARYSLGYGRDDGGKFGLVVRATVEETDDRGRRMKASVEATQEWETIWSKRLDQVSRPLRVAAVARLPEFIACLCEQMEKAVAVVNSNLEKVRAPSAEIRNALSKPWRNSDFLLRGGVQEMPPTINGLAKRESRLTNGTPGK